MVMMGSNSNRRSRSSSDFSSNMLNQALHTQMDRIERLDLGAVAQCSAEEPLKTAPISKSNYGTRSPTDSKHSLHKILIANGGRETPKRKMPRLGSSLWNLSQNSNRTRTFSSGMPGSPGTRRAIKSSLTSSSSTSLADLSSLPSMSSLHAKDAASASTDSLDSSRHKSNSLRNERMVVQMAQRSSSKEVKAMLSQLDNDHESVDEECAESHCEALSQLAPDSFYSVIISKHGGARILCKTMKAFFNNTSIQESCCLCLAHLPRQPYLQTRGVSVLKDCLEGHPQSSHVQSAACRAWATLLRHATDELVLPDGIDELVERAAHMFLTPAGRRAADRVRQLLLEREQAGQTTPCGFQQEEIEH